VLETEIVERERPPDCEENRVALGGRSIVELDHVSAIGARTGPSRHRTHAEPHLDP
jgi:hypothetical protein